MSTLRTAIGFLLLFLCACSQKEPAAGAACPNNNPFIMLVKLPKYETPVVTSKVCAFEFGVYGTCCSQTDIESYAKDEAKDLSDNVDRISREYEEFKGIIPKVYELLKRIAFAPLHKDRTDWNKQIGYARGLLQNATLLQYFEENLKVAHKAGDFKEHSKECWKFQSKVRDVALC